MAFVSFTKVWQLGTDLRLSLFSAYHMNVLYTRVQYWLLGVFYSQNLCSISEQDIKTFCKYTCDSSIGMDWFSTVQATTSLFTASSTLVGL